MERHGVSSFRKVFDRDVAAAERFNDQRPVTLAFRTGKLNRTTEGFSGVGKCDRPIRHYASAAGVVFMISFCLRMDSLWISSTSFKIGRASCRERVCQYV